jgi:hypothetical protein
MNNNLSLINLLRVPLITDPLVDFLKVEGCIWCSLNKNKLQERKRQRLNNKLSSLNNGEAKKSSQEVIWLKNSLSFFILKMNILNYLYAKG